jgi:hypothetical protein
MTVHDYVRIRPPPSKADPFAIVWGTRPIYGAFHPTAKINMARELRNLYAHAPVTDEELDKTPLFIHDDGSPFTGNFIDNFLKKSLGTFMTTEETKKLSPHSFRIFLACALRAANASDSVIQALCRWQSIESLHTYALMDKDGYMEYINRAMEADSMAIRVDSLPMLDLVDVGPAEDAIED